MKKFLIRLIIVAAIAGAAYGGYRAMQGIQSRQETIATTKVRQGDVVVKSYARGELRAVRSVTLTAPNLFGTVQVTRMAPLGAFAREKDLVVEFDDSEVQSRLEEKQLELDQIDEQMKKSQADLAIRQNQDQVDLLNARYAVRRAELEVKRNELLAAIDQKKNELNLEEAKRRLKQLENDVQSRLEQAQAEIAVLREKKNKGLVELQREKARLMQVKLLSPISGLVAIKQNRGTFMFAGMQVPDIREGDQVQPGIPVADVLDLSEVEVVARVGELDRANLREGQPVLMRMDALAEKTLHGTIKTMSGTASANAMSFDPAKKFDVIFSVDMKELLSALGAKPDQIQKILATAEANRKKPIAASSSTSMFAGMAGGMPGGMPGGGMPGGGRPGGGAPGADGGQSMTMQMSPGGSGGGGGGRPADAGGGMPEEVRKMRDAMRKALDGKKMEDLSPDEQKKLMAKVQADLAKQGIKMPAMTAGASGGRMPFGGGGMPMGFGGGGSQFTEKEMAAAKLPPPPEEDSQLDVLLRPGLLADVEIIVEEMKNALSLPMQAIFEKDGKPVVYVRKGTAFEARLIQPLKRSESTMVIASGVTAGEIVALTDPTSTKKDKKDKKEKGGGAMGGLGKGGAK